MLRYDSSLKTLPPETEAGGGLRAPGAALFAGVEVRRVLLGHRLLISAFVLAMAALALFIAHVLPPRYISTAELYIDPQSLQILDKPLTPSNDGGSTAIDQVESQTRVITSQSVLKRVVEQEHLDADAYFAAGAGLPVNNAVDALSSKVVVRRPERTFVVSISVTSNGAEKSANIANSVAQAYIDEHAAAISEAANRTSSMLAGRLEYLKAQAATAQNAVEDYKNANDLVGTRKDLISEDQLMGANNALVAARARTAAAQASYDQVQTARKNNDAAALSESLHSQTIAALRTQQAEAKRKLAEISADLGPLHPQVRQAEMTIRDINRSIDDEISRIVSSAKSDLDRAKQNEASVGRMLTQMKIESAGTSAALGNLRELESEAGAAQTLYQNVLLRARETGEFGKLDSSNTRIISQAVPASRHSFPPRNAVLLAAGGLSGLLLGLLAAFGLEWAHVNGTSLKLRTERVNPKADSVPKAFAETDGRGPSFLRALLRAKPVPEVQTPPHQSEAQAPIPASGTAPADVKAGQEPVLLGHLNISYDDYAPAYEPLPGEDFVPDLAAIGLAAGIAGSRLSEQTAELCRALNLHEHAGEPNRIVFAGINQGDVRSIAALNVALRAAGVGLKTLLIDADAEEGRLSAHLATLYPQWPEHLGPAHLGRRNILRTLNHVDLVPRRTATSAETSQERDPFYGMRLLRQAMQSAEDYDVVIFDGPGLTAGRQAKFLFERADQIVLVQSSGGGTAFAQRAFMLMLGDMLKKFCGQVVVDLPPPTMRRSEV